MANSYTVATYSPSDVSLSFGGYSVVGWDNITISRTSPSFTTVKGIRGKHTRVPSGDTSATITLSIIQTSQSNDVLSEVHRLDIENGTGRLSITLKDGSGASVFSSDEAYIINYPETTYSGNLEMRNWTIFCQTTRSFIVAGNTNPQDSLFNTVINAVSNIF